MIRTGHYRSLPRRFRRPTLLVVGCGDVGCRIGRLLGPRVPERLRIVGLVRDPEQADRLRRLGIAPMLADLDRRPGLLRAAALSHWMVDLAPPPGTGAGDPRTGRLIAQCARAFLARARFGRPRLGPPVAAPARRAAFGARARWVYISTTGVYGDTQGARFDETRRVAPQSERAARRVDAEQRMRAAVRRGQASASILRVPGIYAHDRLPLERLHKALPALRPDEDVYTNHIHADDLARIAWLALFRARPGRVVHAVDDSGLKMGDYFDRVADAFGLPRPPRVPRAELAARVSPAMLSFMSESRRLLNRRLKAELRFRFRYPSVDAALAVRLL